MANSLETVVEGIEQYYDSGSNTWSKINDVGVTAETFTQTANNYTVPITASDGSIIGWTEHAYENLELKDYIDSNVGNSSVNLNVPPAIKTSTTGNLEISSGIGFAESTGTTVKGVLGTVGASVFAVSSGITLGKTIDKALYNANPEYWNSIGLSTLNPETWDSITADDPNSAGSKVLNVLYGLNDDGTVTAYADERALAYYAMCMQEAGLFTEGTAEEGYAYDGTPAQVNNQYQYGGEFKVIQDRVDWGEVLYSGGELQPRPHKIALLREVINIPDTPPDGSFILEKYTAYYLDPDYNEVTFDSNAFRLYLSTGEFSGYNPVVSAQYYYSGHPSWTYNITQNLNAPVFTSKDALDNYLKTGDDSQAVNRTGGTQPEGVSNTEGAKRPDLKGVTTLAGAITVLSTLLPELWDKAITNKIPQADGTLKDVKYVPIALPQAKDYKDTQPSTGVPTQANPNIDPTSPFSTWIPSSIEIPPTPTTPVNPPTTGTGTTPIFIPPIGATDGLWSIYNPSLAEIRQFGAWLWSPNFVDQLLKMFSNPMEAIIGLHKVFAPPQVSGRGTIKVGYLNSGVPSNLVGSQYTSVDCGTVSLKEYFNNVFDYSPYTIVKLYLPFIGIVDLDVANVMRSSIHIVYRVDVLTGACYCEVQVLRDGEGGALYTYSGNASVQYPLSSGSYMGIITGILGVAGSVVGKSPMGVLHAIDNAHTTVQQSGSLSGNSGAMGIKKPYIIISRPQTALAGEVEKFVGYPSNEEVYLNTCTGYTKVKRVHVDNINNATNEEKNEIESLLKSGVIIQ